MDSSDIDIHCISSNHLWWVPERGDFLYVGDWCEIYLSQVDWGGSRPMFTVGQQAHAPDCYDVPLQCACCGLWLRSQSALQRHLDDWTYCGSARVFGTWVRRLGRRYRGTLETENLKDILPPDLNVEGELATFSQLQFLFSNPINTPFLCAHCHSFFPGVRCLTEHLEFLSWDRPPIGFRHALGRKNEILSYGRFQTASAHSAGHISLIPGMEIKFPILSEQCRCLNKTSKLHSARKCTSKPPFFRWYALTSAAVLSDFSRRRMFKRLCALPRVVLDPRLFRFRGVVSHICSFMPLTDPCRSYNSGELTWLSELATNIGERRKQQGWVATGEVSR